MRAILSRLTEALRRIRRRLGTGATGRTPELSRINAELVRANVALGAEVADHQRREAERLALLAREQAARAAAELAYRRLEILYRTTQQVSGNVDLERAIMAVVAGARQLFAADRAAVYYREESGRYVCPILFGQSAADAERICAACAVAPICHQVGRAWPPPDVPSESPASADEQGAVERGRRVLTLPVLRMGDPPGFLAIYHDQPRPYHPDEVRVAQALADQAAVTVANIHLYEAERRSRAEAEAARRGIETLLGTIRDSNRHLEATLDELRAAQQQLVQQERLRALAEMASGVAHDFNNALTPILGASQLLLRRPELLADRDQASRFLAMIHTGAERSASVIRRLREFYHSPEGRRFFQSVDLHRVVGRAVEAAQPRWRDEARAQRVTIDVRTDLQEVPAIAGDEAELQEALTNLIANAVEAMPEGGTLTLRTRSGDGTAIVEVGDTGVGMTDEVRQRCLEPFFSTLGGHGSGLGLAIVYGIVRRHGGTIAVESAPGQGTTVALHLPVGTASPVPQRTVQADPVAPLSVLVVDDEPDVREVVREYLATDRHAVETAGSGSEALAKLRSSRFDLVVTDRAMPGMTGDELAAAVKELAPGTPVIMLTGLGDLMTSAGERPAGVARVVGKPVTLATLREAVSATASDRGPMQ